LNKSFDVLPQIKDDDTPSADPIVDNSVSEFCFYYMRLKKSIELIMKIYL
jgi:hypothetical protein